MNSNISEYNYFDFIKELKQKIYSAKSKAIIAVNRQMIELYFDIGKEIVSKQNALGWGKSIVEKMSKDLKNEFGSKSGFSSSNLWRMRNFYLTYKDNPNLAQAVRDIFWSINIIIFEKCKNEKEREYYIKQTIQNGWNRNVLLYHIKTELFARDNKEIKLTNFEMPHENPAIGILLCTNKNNIEVEYSLLNTNQPMGVATYTTQTKLPQELKGILPSKDKLIEKLKGNL